MKMSRRCAVALAILIVCPFAAKAQAGAGTIQGVVRTESRVLEGVSVTVNGGQPSVQRPFAEEHRPADLEEQEERAKAALRALQGQGVSDER
jgi:hypothetical protein